MGRLRENKQQMLLTGPALSRALKPRAPSTSAHRPARGSLSKGVDLNKTELSAPLKLSISIRNSVLGLSLAEKDTWLKKWSHIWFLSPSWSMSLVIAYPEPLPAQDLMDPLVNPKIRKWSIARTRSRDWTAWGEWRGCPSCPMVVNPRLEPTKLWRTL